MSLTVILNYYNDVEEDYKGNTDIDPTFGGMLTYKLKVFSEGI